MSQTLQENANMIISRTIYVLTLRLLYKLVTQNRLEPGLTTLDSEGAFIFHNPRAFEITAKSPDPSVMSSNCLFRLYWRQGGFSEPPVLFRSDSNTRTGIVSSPDPSPAHCAYCCLVFQPLSVYGGASEARGVRVMSIGCVGHTART